MSEEAISRTCKDCDEEFVILEAEAKWFEERDMQLPKRCADCRRKRRAERESESKNK